MVDYDSRIEQKPNDQDGGELQERRAEGSGPSGDINERHADGHAAAADYIQFIQREGCDQGNNSEAGNQHRRVKELDEMQSKIDGIDEVETKVDDLVLLSIEEVVLKAGRGPRAEEAEH